MGWRRSSPSSTKRAATWRAGGAWWPTSCRPAAAAGGAEPTPPDAPPGWAPMFDGAPAVDVARSDDIMALVAAGRPAVLPELQRRAGFAPAEAWTAEALAGGALGGRVVKVSVSQSGRFDGPERGPLWGLGDDDEVLVRPPETHMRLADLLALLRAETREAFYLEYNALHQYLGEELRAMAPAPADAAGLRPLVQNVWLGKGGTASPLHYDDYENLLAQVRGTKELLLFPPADHRNLYYTARAKGTLRYRWPDTWERKAIEGDAREAKVVFGSSVDLSNPDLGRHPRLEKATAYRVSLREGETLYLPAFWHHEVRSAPAGAGGVNVAVNFWFKNCSAPPEGM